MAWRSSVDHGGNQSVAERRSAAVLVLVIATAAALVAPAHLACEPRKPVLVVLITSSDPAFRAREQQLATQLELALDEFAIERFSPDLSRLEAPAQVGESPFASLSLPKKLKFVAPFASKVSAVAVIWMEDGGGGAAFLHVASQSTDRAFVRIVRAGGGPNVEEELALAAQELLGQVYMLSGSNQKPIQEAVDRVVDDADSMRPLGVDWGVLPFLETGAGIYGHEGSSLRFGGGIGVETMLGDSFFVRLSVAALAGPFMEPRDGVVSGWAIEPGVKLGQSWEVTNQFRLGFVAGAAPVYSMVHVSLGSGDHQAADWWNFHGTVGANARLSLGDRIAVVVEPTLGLWAVRKSFYRVSDDSVVLRTRFVGWNVTAGVWIAIW